MYKFYSMKFLNNSLFHTVKKYIYVNKADSA